jgi:hypothetical protein
LKIVEGLASRLCRAIAAAVHPSWGACAARHGDFDGIPHCQANCDNSAKADQSDSDGDGVGDACETATVPGGCGASGMGMASLLVLGLSLTRQDRRR